MEKMSKYFIENGKNGEERLVLKNLKGTEIAAGRFGASNMLSRRKLKRFSADAVNADIEMQIKEGYEKKSGTKFEVFKAANDKISFRLRESDGNVIITGGTYNELTDCLAAIKETRDSLREISHSNELTAIHQKPVFKKEKAEPRFASIAEEREQAEKHSIDTGFSVMMNEKQRSTFIMGRITDEKITSPRAAIRALNSLHYTMGFENSQQEFDEEDVEIRRQKDGTTFYRMKQYHNGIPVDGHTLIVSTDSEGNAETLSGQYAKISCNDDIKITEEQAKANIEKKYGVVLSSEGLTYYVDDNEKSTLCWRFNTEEYLLYISTESGETVNMYPNIIPMDINTNRHVTNTSGATIDVSILNKDGGAPFSLSDGSRRIEVYDGRDTMGADRPIQVNSLDNANDLATLTNSRAVSAYNNLSRVYDYYLNVLGRKGADDNGKNIRLHMNYYYYKNQENACFLGGIKDRTEIALGRPGNIPACLDVLGHEFTHAVNDAIWDPIYERKSGALDEAYADIMGELIQDGTFDTFGEGTSFPRYFNNGKNIFDYHSIGSNETLNVYNDWEYVHENSSIISHTAYLIYKNWPTENRRCELSALFYKSMNYLGQKSDFADCYTALVKSALKMGSAHDMREKIGYIADAFLETKTNPYVWTYDSRYIPKKITGKVTDPNDNNKGVPGVTVSAYLEGDSTTCKGSTITNSKGEYELELALNRKYVIKTSRADGYSKSVATGKITSSNCGPWNISATTNSLMSLLFSFRRTFIISGNVKRADTGNPVAGATVKILKGSHTESQVMTMEPDVVLTTDSNGNFFTAALPKGDYDIWAYSEVSNSKHCMTRIVHMDKDSNSKLRLVLEKRARSYVTGISIRSDKSAAAAKNRTKSGYTLIDVDLNKGPKGDWIFLSYCVDNYSKPITNFLIYESDKAETWKSKSITHNNIKATYRRLNVNLNRNAGGKYLYLCYTSDTRFDPLTKLDVLVKTENAVRAPYWSGVRVVKGGSSSTDQYSDLNAGVPWDQTVHIMQTRKEIM